MINDFLNRNNLFYSELYDLTCSIQAYFSISGSKSRYILI